MERRPGSEGPLLRLLAFNGSMGFGFGLLFATMLLLCDLHGLATLMAQTIGLAAGWALLAFVFGITFAAVAAGTAIMLLGPEEESGPHGLRPIPVRPPHLRDRA
jgi:hypothetical protein